MRSVSVIICTINESGILDRCVSSVLGNEYADFEVVVVDQSPDRSALSSLLRFNEDKRLRYLHSTEQGESLARNLGLTHADGELILCTDDDCLVAPDWIERFVESFSRHSEAQLIFGRVCPPEWYRTCDGFVPSYEGDTSGTQPSEFRFGISANMGFRRELIDRIGNFDEALGAGGALRAGEDFDFAARAVRIGETVLSDPRPVVVHEGGVRRPGKEAMAIWYRNGVGIGALIGKSLRCQHWIMVLWLLTLLGGQLGDVARRVVTLRRPIGLSRTLTSFLGATAGFGAGMRHPIKHSGHGRRQPPACAFTR